MKVSAVLLVCFCSGITTCSLQTDVILDDRAELICKHDIITSLDIIPIWVITGSRAGERSKAIHPLDDNPVPLVLQQRGFESEYLALDGVLSLSLRVLGSEENNQTEISCKLVDETELIESFVLNVIGPPERPGEVRGWVVEFSPLRLRLEWEEPFSHTDHPVLHYILYTRDGGATANTTDNNITLSLGHNVYNCSHIGIGVAAVSDIGESEPSPVESIRRDVTDKQFSIDGNLLSQNKVIVLKLKIKFPELCEGQEMRYRVEVEEERTGRLVYQDTRVSEYRGRDVDYSNTTSSLLDHGYYTALVFLHTGGQSTSSFPLRLSVFQEDATGRNSDTVLMLTVIGVLAAVLLCLLIAVVVIGVVYLRNRFSTSMIPQEPKENRNPIYEGPLYENMEESHMEESPGTSLPPPPSARRRGSVSRSVDNVYHSSPVPIPTGPETEGLYAELLAAKKQESQTRAPGDGEEETYTIMSPAGHAARDGFSIDPYVEERAAWIGNRK